MISRKLAAYGVAILLIGQGGPAPALADNPMGYQLMSASEAASLPRNRGALGLDVERAQQMIDRGMTFDIIRVTKVRRGSAGEAAGLRPRDDIIALDGHVFPTLVAFSSYIGSVPPGRQMMVDYIPAGGGPEQAQRLTVTVGQAGQTFSPDNPTAPDASGMSTGAKVAIGAGAVALLGCYEMGCFSHHAKPNGGRPPVQQPNGMQPR